MNRNKWFLAAVVALLLGVALWPQRHTLGLESLAGIDHNQDGIRDDVEKLIEEKYGKDARLRLAVRQLAREYQQDIVSAGNQPVAVGRLGESETSTFSSKGVDCLHLLAGDRSSEILKEIQAATANTAIRIKALIHYSARFHGKVLSGEMNPQGCDFEQANK